MRDQIMVSIICNVFNHETYVRDALEGFVMQKTNFPFEILVHDDASTDASAAVIREYEEKYPNLIKPIYQTVNQYSQKKSITRDFQVPRACGKYLAMCEGDDYWTDPLKLQKQVDFLEQNPEYTLCTCSTVWLDMRTNKTINLCRTDIDKDVSLEDLILEKKGRIFQYGTYVIKREVLQTLPEWAKHFGVGDTALAMYAASVGKVRMLADVMAVYRNHAAGSWTSRVAADATYKTAALRKMIAGLNEFNEATNYQYDAVVTQRQKQIHYNIARSNRDWNAMRTGELKDFFESRSLKSKLMDYLFCKMPSLYAFVYQILK